jgi:ActR/RegA family two-component response regulator
VKNSRKKAILAVGDFRHDLVNALKRRGYVVMLAKSEKNALLANHRDKPSFVIAPAGFFSNGFASKLRDDNSGVTIVMMSTGKKENLSMVGRKRPDFKFSEK